jgi:RNA polymerase sigma-70 factor (ECF subfamily)
VSVNPVYLQHDPPPPERTTLAADVPDTADALARSYPGLMAVLTRRSGNPQLAFDLLQDAIVTTLAKQREGVDVAGNDFAGYVFRTAINHLRNHLRRERDTFCEESWIDRAEDAAPSPPDCSQRDINRRLVRALLEKMTNPRDRQVLVLHYLDERDRDEVCRELQLTPAQFARIAHRARQRLRELIEQAGYRSQDLLSTLLLLTVLFGG